MIITCQTCSTRFRFDDALMEGKGVWVRCSRCRNVFFQENPDTEAVAVKETVLPPVEVPETPKPVPAQADDIDLDATVKLETSIPEEPQQEYRHDDTVLIIPPPAPPEALPEGPSSETWTRPEGVEKDRAHEPLVEPAAVEAETTEDEDDEEAMTGEVKKEGRFTWKLILLIVVINLLIGSVVYLWFFPEIGEQALNGLRSVPVIRSILGTGKQPGDVNLGLVKIKDVTRRLEDNFSEGPLLIIEGRVVNKSMDVLTRVRIQGKLYDATDRILQMRMSYCGNVLTAMELNALTEGDIQRRLSSPQDKNVSRDRLPPNGEIPFMIVFSLDKAGVDKKAPVIKTGVIPAGAERLLQ